MTNLDIPTVLIVDDDEAVRDSIEELVRSVGIQAKAYASAQAFLVDFDPEWPGCLVLDVRMAGMSGLQLQEVLNQSQAPIPIILITGYGDVPMAVQALKAGAFDFIQKPYRNQQLLDSINKALEVDAAARKSRLKTSEFGQRLETLTNREREIFDILLGGGSSKDVARELGISKRTVEAHRHNLLQKLEVTSFKELILNQDHRGSSDRN